MRNGDGLTPARERGVSMERLMRDENFPPRGSGVQGRAEAAPSEVWGPSVAAGSILELGAGQGAARPLAGPSHRSRR